MQESGAHAAHARRCEKVASEQSGIKSATISFCPQRRILAVLAFHLRFDDFRIPEEQRGARPRLRVDSVAFGDLR